jgi:replicative DNA helicase
MKENLTIPSELLEEYILISAINNKSFFIKVLKYLKTPSFKKSYFNDPKNQLIFNILAVWFENYATLPTLKDILYLIERHPIDSEMKVLVNGMVNKYYTEDVSQINQQMIFDEAKKFIQESRVYEAMALSQKDIEEENYGAIVEKMKDAINVNFDKDLGISIKNVKEVFESIEKINSSGAIIDTGIPSLNMILDGGFRESEMTVIAAPPGIGKTLVLGCFGIHAFITGKKVLVITMETSKERLLMRYLENLTGKNKLNISSNPKRVEEILETKISMIENNGDLIIKEYLANQADSNDINALLTDLELFNQWKPDLIIVDYLLITAANDRRLDPGDSYKYYKRVAEDLRNISKEHKVPLLTACQINREGQGDRGGTKALITSKNVSESRGILDTADVFITLNQTELQKDKKEIVIYVDKNRNGESAKKIVCEIDYDIMTLRQKDISPKV